MPSDYERAKREMPGLKRKLTLAKKRGPQAVADAVREAYAAFDEWGIYPDNWHLFESALNDAKEEAARKGITLQLNTTAAPLPERILRSIRQRHGLEADDTSQDDIFNAFTLDDCLNSYLSWEGIYGYTEAIADIARHYGAKDSRCSP